jgi:hypothetical protein
MVQGRPPVRLALPISPPKPQDNAPQASLLGFVQDSATHSMPIGRASCSGLVQSILSPRTRPWASYSSVCHLRPRRRTKNALHYAECGMAATLTQHGSASEAPHRRLPSDPSAREAGLHMAAIRRARLRPAAFRRYRSAVRQHPQLGRGVSRRSRHHMLYSIGIEP